MSRFRSFAVVLSFLPALGFAQTPAPLTGAFFSGPLQTMGTCGSTGAGTFSFSATGTVTGTYPGAFTQVGTVTVGSEPAVPEAYFQGLRFFRVVSVDTFFTIDSPAGQVTGAAHLITVSDEVSGHCSAFATLPTIPTSSGTYRAAVSNPYGLAYDATISTDAGLFADHGIAGMTVNDLRLDSDPSAPPATFNAAFQSDGVVSPIATEGRATGGGQAGADVTFGLEAKFDGGRLVGGCTVVDRATDTRVKCRDVTSFVRDGDQASIYGHATVNDADTIYRIDVTDLAEPGRGSDQFTLTTGSGYSAGGVLTAGNVQVR